MPVRYTLTPNSVDDAALDVYQFRLLFHIRRRGVCFESVRKMAETCQMSVGKVSETRQWLLDQKWIEQSQDPVSGKWGYRAIEMTATDEQANSECSPDEQERSPHEQNPAECSPHEQECSPHEQECSPHERDLKFNPLSLPPEEYNQKQKHNLIMVSTPEKTSAAGTPKTPNIFRIYEQNIGALTPLLSEKLQAAEHEYPETWIQDAIDIAVEQNKRSWAYCEAILKRWQTQGKDNGRRNGESTADLDNALKQWVSA